MRTRLSVCILVSLALMAAFAAAFHVGSGIVAASSCDRTHVVQRGDTLAGIAQLYGTTVQTLLGLNPDLSSQHALYTSQVLCVPVDPDADTVLGSKVVLEVTYQYTPTDSVEAAWNLVRSRGGYIGKRLEFPLNTVGDLHVITETAEIEPYLEEGSRTSLVALRTSQDSNTYVLAFVGAGPPLSNSLRISETESVVLTEECGTPVGKALGGPNIADVRLILWLEAADGYRFPLHVSHLHQASDLAGIRSCYVTSGPEDRQLFVFALRPLADGDSYQAAIFMHNGVLGPPGFGTRVTCRALTGRSWFHRIIRAFRGCR